jgi:uncharacterized protein YegL
MSTENRPGGKLMSRPLHFFWIADCSGSMSGDKIHQLNYAVRTALPEMQRVALENPNAEVKIRAIKFSDTAEWHVGQPTAVENFSWTDLTAGGITSMGRALSLVTEQLKMPPMEQRALPPAIVLVSDGQPTDDFASGLSALMEQPWGQKAVRLAVAIGGDADLDVLQKFIGNPEIRPLTAKNPEDLVNFIRWASTVAIKQASSPVTPGQEIATGRGGSPIPIVHDMPASSGDAVW